MTGCATPGPGATDKNYKKAIEPLQIAGDVIYSIPAWWFPNTLLGDLESLNHTSISGRLFVNQERLVFAVYDEETNSFLKGYEVAFFDIKWMTGKSLGIARIIRFQSNNEVQSFLFGRLTKSEGQELDKDQIMNDILLRFQSKKQTP